MRLILCFACLLASAPGFSAKEFHGADQEHHTRFWELSDLNWHEVFVDPGTNDWKSNWTLDGLKATVTNNSKGMNFMAGPIPKENASHAVLWTTKSFEGDLKIEYEYTRTDNANQFVTILYIQATGSDEGHFTKDILEWADKRTVPAMNTYFNNMNTYHISYAAYGGDPIADDYDYIRARRYMPTLKKGLNGTALTPDSYERTGLFKPGVPHHITVVKIKNEIFMQIRNPEKEYLCYFENKDLPEITEGRIGLRHMFTRSARYRDIRVSILK